MPRHVVRCARLRPFGDRPADVLGVEAEVSTTAEGVLAARYRVEGDTARLRIPQAAAPRFADGLWRHTCFEIFVRSGDGPAYREFNFSPSGEWAVYEFDRYRVAARPIDDLPDPQIAVKSTGRLFSLSAQVHVQGSIDATLSIGVSAVIEDREGALSYWALAHPSEKPDFHHPDSFVLQI